MKIIQAPLEGVLIIEPEVYGDHRGFFMESYNRRVLGVDHDWPQDNISTSVKGTLRGLHFQKELFAQAKYVRVLQGEVFDVAVDIRAGSPTFGKWFGETLSCVNKLAMYIPVGFAHGFVVLSDTALFMYKVSNYYTPQAQRAIAWDDPDIGIRWPIEPTEISDKDRHAKRLSEI